MQLSKNLKKNDSKNKKQASNKSNPLCYKNWGSPVKDFSKNLQS